MFNSKLLDIINNTLELDAPVRDISEISMTSFCDMEEVDLSCLDELENELI